MKNGLLELAFLFIFFLRGRTKASYNQTEGSVYTLLLYVYTLHHLCPHGYPYIALCPLHSSFHFGNHSISQMVLQYMAFYIIPEYVLQNKNMRIFGDNKMLEQRTKHARLSPVGYTTHRSTVKILTLFPEFQSLD